MKWFLLLALLVSTGCAPFLDSVGLGIPDYYPHCYPYYCSSPYAVKCACGRCNLPRRNIAQPVNNSRVPYPVVNQSKPEHPVRPEPKLIKRTIKRKVKEVRYVEDGNGDATWRTNRLFD